MMTLARVVKCIYSEQAVLALMHVLPCHVSKSEARSLENVDVATLVLEVCCMTQIVTETDTEALPSAGMCGVRACGQTVGTTHPIDVPVLARLSV